MGHQEMQVNPFPGRTVQRDRQRSPQDAQLSTSRDMQTGCTDKDATTSFQQQKVSMPSMSSMQSLSIYRLHAGVDATQKEGNQKACYDFSPLP